jgi:glutathione S-transferase
MNLPILYSFRRCPYSMRARMALAYSGIRVELREIQLNNMPQDLLHISPKATVPVLNLPDGSILEQSLDIMHWALSISDPQQWLVDDYKSVELIGQNDEDFKPLLDAYKYADRFPQLSQLDHRNNAEFFLHLLEHRLVDHPYLLSDRLTITDVAIMPFIRQFAGVDPQWFEQCQYTGVRRWLNQQIESELFKSVMAKYAFWHSAEKAVYFVD